MRTFVFNVLRESGTHVCCKLSIPPKGMSWISEERLIALLGEVLMIMFSAPVVVEVEDE